MNFANNALLSKQRERLCVIHSDLAQSSTEMLEEVGLKPSLALHTCRLS